MEPQITISLSDYELLKKKAEAVDENKIVFYNFTSYEFPDKITIYTKDEVVKHLVELIQSQRQLAMNAENKLMEYEKKNKKKYSRTFFCPY